VIAMIETLFVLFLSVSGKYIEWTPHDSLSDCLSVKRKIERNIGGSNGYSCSKETVKLGTKLNGEKEILEFVEN
jgi:hypothetical protein